MSDIVTEQTASVLRIQLNRPEKKNAMTSGMYLTLADMLNSAAKDDQVKVVLWHGAGDSFCAGNDIEDFVKNPPGPGESPQASLMDSFLNFDKPIVAAVHGMVIGGGTTMLTHCDFVFAGESARFQMPFVNLGRGAGIRIHLLPSRTHGISSRGRVDSIGATLQRLSGGRVGTRDPCNSR